MLTPLCLLDCGGARRLLFEPSTPTTIGPVTVI
jgi:hypothetical protein